MSESTIPNAASNALCLCGRLPNSCDACMKMWLARMTWETQRVLDLLKATPP